MNLNPLAPITPTPPTPTQAMASTLSQIQLIYNKLTPAMLKAYQSLYTLVVNNPYGLAQADINTALGANAAVFMADAAILKAVLNYKQPGIITDSIPSATITLPS